MKPAINPWYLRVFALVITSTLFASNASAEDFFLHKFKRQQLTNTYYSEGANAGDLNNDGYPDIIYGPYWYEGPDFKIKHELYSPKAQNKEGYSDNFFSWVYDFNGDGWNDVFVVGFPGKPAYVYENPKKEGHDKHWKKHQVFDSVSNESPHFINIVGDAKPELVCTSEGYFGFATIDWKEPFKKWVFHPISEKSAPGQFGHGLGVGDLNGDGLNDIIVVNGWFEQPKKDALTSRWTFHEVPFSNAYGGAEMYVYDVDGDGLNDVITSLAAHDYGLAWYQQDKSGPKTVFRQHLIMGNKAEQNRYGTLFSELHSVALVDMDGDGLKDIVTGKTFYSHHKSSPMWDAGAVVYWFKLVRSKDGVDWIPHKIDDVSGIGRQISIVDLNKDGLPDIVVGGMVGSHALFHQKEKVSETEWKAAQPKALRELLRPLKRGPASTFGNNSDKVEGVIEGEDLKSTKANSDAMSVQEMKSFNKDRWSGNKQLFWNGAKPGDKLELEFEVQEKGKYSLSSVFTMARDYGMVQVHVDDAPIGKVLDLYNFPDVITTGQLTLGTKELDAGKHKLVLEMKGANPAADKGDKIGLDYIKLVKE